MTAEAMEPVEIDEMQEVVEEEGYEFGDLDIARLRRFMVNRQGQDFLLYAGLVTALHQVSGGYFAIETRLEQLPTQENGMVAVCSARVQVFDPEQPEVVRRTTTGVGDASPGNVSKQMQGAIIRMAETRSKARALRDLLGVAEVTFEELGPGGADDHPERSPQRADRPSTPRGAEPVDRIEVKGKRYDRPQVLTIYQRRLAEAKEANLVIPPGDLLPDDAALPLLVGASQEIKRRLDARAGLDD